jgi:hypothetical protein
MTNPRVADRLAGPSNYYPFSACLIMASTFDIPLKFFIRFPAEKMSHFRGEFKAKVSEETIKIIHEEYIDM